jgi:general secretion pathway protein L
MSRKVLGLEIREESVAAVLLESGFKGSVLESQGYFPVPADKPGDEGLKEALEALVAAMKPAGATCVLGIPANGISFRNLSLPFHDLKKIRQILPFELEPALPQPVEELIFDFEAVKRDGHQDLLAFAVQKDNIQRYRELLDSVHMSPVAILPAGYAAARIMAMISADDEDFLFIDTGMHNHTIFAVSSGRIRLVRTLPIAGSGTPVARSLETTLQRTFTALRESQDIDVNPAAVFSVGPRSHLLKPGKESPTLLGAPVRSMGGLRAFPRLKGSLETEDWDTGHLDIALALALMETEAVGGVNFSSERSTIQHYWSEYRNNIILTGALIVFTLLILLAGQIFTLKAKANQLAELNQEIESVFKSTFPQVTRVVDPLAQMRSKIKAIGQGGTGVDFTAPRVRVIDILNALSRRIPASLDVKVEQMVVGIDNVLLSGNTDTFNTVDAIKGRLAKANIFKNVTISSADLEKSGKRVRFKLKLDF